MWGTKTSKTMLPCRRGVHLHKSDSFEMGFGQKKNWNSQKWYGKTSTNIIQKTPNFRMLAPIWNHLLEIVSGWRVLITTYFSEPLGGTPWTGCWPPLRHPWANCLDFLKEFTSKFAPNVKDSRAAFRYFVNKWHQPHLQKHKQGLKATYSESIRTRSFLPRQV